jgi:hypothetical protein
MAAARAVALIVGLGVASSTAARAKTSKTWTSKNGNITATGQGQTLTEGKLLVQGAGRALTLNGSLACNSVTTKIGSVSIYNLATGGYAYVPGIAAYGPISLIGSDRVGRFGNGVVSLAGAGLWNPSTGAVQWVGGGLTAVSVPAGASMPTGEDETAAKLAAEALFDQIFGTAARRGYPFDKARYSKSSPTAVAYYALGKVPLTIEGATSASAAGAMGIALVKGQVLAVMSAGAGAYGTYIPQ